MVTDSPYPELKKTHTMAHVGRPWTDFKPAAAAPVWGAIEGLARYYVLVAALELDVFDTLGRIGPTTVDVIAKELDVSEPHLQALLDSVVALELLEQFRDLYDLNDAARRYLTSDGAATMAELIPVAPGPHENWTRLADTIRNGRPATPIEDDPAAFYVPLVEGTFTTLWRCAGRADFKVRYSDLDSPRILDLGAGGAPWSIAMLQACPDATAVINDMAGVIDVARAKTAEFEVADRCEFREGDFHTIDLESGCYDIVVLGHICRTEGPEGARNLINRAYAALKPEGRLILADYFVDFERKFNPHAVLMGMTMMTSTVNGFPISNEQATDWMQQAGFEAMRLIEPIGFQFCYVATKPKASARSNT
jgi:SAM-dependent methyltransferase